ncbi:porin family protein [Ferrimonas marina]|uniref:MetA-pathway of phenol degradation n=1 Tax=Ferrimonas marina TaxID=299255 RepID=A0A1M5R5F5_9GAMM|nr:hypothetical protein [Ferrimonas marina]SHH21617.1 hypothetical protein SAMN02745129_1494 [Ferrimonas marina]
MRYQKRFFVGGFGLWLWALAPAMAQSMFPIWGEEARARGYELPRPYGLTLSVMTMEQPLVIDSIVLDSGNPNLPLDQLVSIDANIASQDSTTYTLRGDLWLFPFLNVYGILGYTKGDSVAPIVANINLPFIPSVETDFALDFQGPSYGAGATLAGGIGNVFALVDINYTYTDLNVLDGDIRAMTATPRVGYRWPMGRHEVRVWAGAMYQDIDQVFRGNISDIGLSDQLVALVPDGKFEVTQHLSDPWNTMVGMMYVLDQQWEFILEGGFGERESLFFSVGRRF